MARVGNGGTSGLCCVLSRDPPRGAPAGPPAAGLAGRVLRAATQYWLGRPAFLRPNDHPEEFNIPRLSSRIAVIVASTMVVGAELVAAQTTLSIAAGLGRLHQAMRCAACGEGPTDAVAVASARFNWAVTPGLDAGLLGQISFSVSSTPGSQRLHTATLMVGASTPLRRAGPWGQVAFGGALVPGGCNVTLARVAAPVAVRRVAVTLDHYGPFDVACGHDPRGAAALSTGLNVPVGRYFIGPELVALATTGDPRLTLITLGIAVRF